MRKKLQNLVVYQDSIKLAKDCFLICDELGVHKRFALSNQIEKSAVSISSNISEGAGGGSSKVFLRHIHIALCSAHELETQLVLAESYCDKRHLNDCLQQLESIIAKLNGLRNYLRKITS
jgi:four helix bundle protein